MVALSCAVTWVCLPGVGERANDSAIVQVAGGESNVLAAENFNLVPHFTDYMVDFATTSASSFSTEANYANPTWTQMHAHTNTAAMAYTTQHIIDWKL